MGMKNYKIVACTNSYIANRDIVFNSKCEVVIKHGLALKEAQKELLDMFNSDYNTNFQNWGLVRCNHRFCTGSLDDGRRFYSFDSRFYSIEKE